MTYLNAILKNTITGTSLKLAEVFTKGKMDTFRLMQSNGDAICDFLKAYGEFSFDWNKKINAWEFSSESGDKIGLIVFERNEEKIKARKEAYYKECKIVRKHFSTLAKNLTR